MPSPAPLATVRLTDQAVVAVHLARAQAGTRKANVAHLVVGLLAEPDGRAGRELRRTTGGQAALRLSQHAGLTAPGLPPLSAALLALPVEDEPAWTDDLLAAAVRVGGGELADLLDDIGVVLPDPLPFPAVPTPESLVEGDLTETFGRGTFLPRGVDDRADRALASARAQGSTSTALLPWLELPAESVEGFHALPEVPIQRIVDRALSREGDRTVGLGDLATAMLSTGLEEMSPRHHPGG